MKQCFLQRFPQFSQVIAYCQSMLPGGPALDTPATL